MTAEATTLGAEQQRIVRESLRRLGIERLVLSIHQLSFPGGDFDIGHGSPYSRRAGELFEWASELGFTGIALGPQGITSRDNPSPYDATAFSRNPLHASFEALVERGWLDGAEVLDAAPQTLDRVHYTDAWDRARQLLARAAERALARDRAGVTHEIACFRARSPWLAEEARFAGAAHAVGHDDWTRWPSPWPTSPSAARSFEIEQMLLGEQHRRLRERATALGVALYADLAIGTSFRDLATHRAVMLPGYAMGAPPSRTNPAGQPWGYPVLDPTKLGPDGGARAFVAARVRRLLDEHDGLRIDHPQGWVCPWVYHGDDPDPQAAVRRGARLFEAPDLVDHPALAAFARVRPDQLDRRRPRYADDWVTSLQADQVDRYSSLVDLFIDLLSERGRSGADLMVEVLSTCPRPLAAVLARHSLGRFRVTQKAVVSDPSDPYRGDRAQPEDWIMTGNHDTPPLRRVVERWQGSGEVEARAAYLSNRLSSEPAQRGRIAEELTRDALAMSEAMLAELFLGPARNVLVFWPDLFGEARLYNRPGEVHADNWAMRVPSRFEQALANAVGDGQAPSLGRAIAMALRARALDRDEEGAALSAALCKHPGARS